MKFFYKLEKKFGKYAIPNLMYYIIGLYVIGSFLYLFQGETIYDQYLSLDIPKILQGQVWRLITFIVYPPGGGYLSIVINLYLYYILGITLERVWGAFRFNVYFFTGVFGHVLAGLLIYLIFGFNYPLVTQYLNDSLFFAFAVVFPEMEFLLFFVVPVKAKWLALFNGIYFLYNFIFGGPVARICILVSLANFIIYFLLTRDFKRVSFKELQVRRNFKEKMKQVPQTENRHRCAVCGRTEVDDPDLTFRYCSRCEGSYEYCQDHIYTHEHVTGKETNHNN